MRDYKVIVSFEGPVWVQASSRSEAERMASHYWFDDLTDVSVYTQVVEAHEATEAA